MVVAVPLIIEKIIKEMYCQTGNPGYEDFTESSYHQ